MSKENSNTEVRLIQLNSYIRPKLQENKGKNWVLDGKNNEFYSYIIDRFNGSPTNAAIINSYIDLIYGGGLTSNDQIGLDKLNEVLKPKELRKVIADFELFGEASFQTIKRKDKKLLPDIYHIPKNLIAPTIENEDYEIDGYWFSRDWTKQYQNPPELYPSFGTDKTAPIEVFNIKPYKAGKIYFADPDYLAGLPYAEMEEEIANLNINSIKNGLSAGYIVNVPDGINWDKTVKDEFESKIKAKLAGSTNASNFVLSFNGRDAEITIVPFPVNDNIHKQWQFLTQEARQQLMTAHRVTSPMLFGIKDATGFGNNAEEMDTAEAQLMKRVIKPKQEFILNALEEIMLFYGIEIDLQFIPLSENADTTNANEIKDTSSIITRTGLSEKKNAVDTILEKYAQDPPENYELHSVEYDIHEEDLELSAIQKSEQDTDIWKIRYAYNVGTSKTPKGASRSFCNKMMGLSTSGKVFRVEDIKQMSDDGVNGEFAHSGGKYDIFLYAGGVNCHHRWERRIYKKKRQEDGKPMIGNALQNTFPVNVSEAKRQGAKIPKNPADVAIAEIDKPNRGSLK